MSREKIFVQMGHQLRGGHETLSKKVSETKKVVQKLFLGTIILDEDIFSV